MSKYICIAKCYELDVYNTRHCIATLEEIEEQKKSSFYGSYCPYNNFITM
jgi:hypothetical protein